MKAYFKIDEKDHIYLLWVAGLETVPIAEKRSNMDHHYSVLARCSSVSTPAALDNEVPLTIPEHALLSIKPYHSIATEDAFDEAALLEFHQLRQGGVDEEPQQSDRPPADGTATQQSSTLFAPEKKKSSGASTARSRSTPALSNTSRSKQSSTEKPQQQQSENVGTEEEMYQDDFEPLEESGASNSAQTDAAAKKKTVTAEEWAQMASRLSAPRTKGLKWDEKKALLESQREQERISREQHQKKLLERLREEEMLHSAFARLRGLSGNHDGSSGMSMTQRTLQPFMVPPIGKPRPATANKAAGVVHRSHSAIQPNTSRGSRTSRSMNSSSMGVVRPGMKMRTNRLQASQSPRDNGQDAEAVGDEEVLEEIMLMGGDKLQKRTRDVAEELSDDGERQALYDAIST
jgi:hypothetical protein